MMDTGRRPEHARKPKLEALLQELNDLLAESEGKVMERFKQPDHPVVFIMGCARSGTTLLLQYLAATGAFSYPSNLIARFYNAPYIGARIQQMLTDSEYDFGGELTGGNTYVSGDFSSCLGKTKGLLSPSEFWYFWRRFVPPQEIQSYAEDALGTLDMRSFVAEIAALESVRGLPVLMKGLYLNWNIEFLSQLFDKAVFIHIHRHPLYNMHSLLRARAQFFGREDAWYSFKPPEYANLCRLSVDEQLAGQVYYTNRAIQEGMAGLAPERRLVIDYESLCAEPEQVFAALAEKLAAQGYSANAPSAASADLHSSCGLEVPAKRVDMLIEAYRQLSGETLELL
jgi:LPS sulfotransferase NodH